MSSQATTVVRADPLRRWTLYAIALLLLSIPWVVGSDAENVGAGIAVVLVMAPFLALLVYVARQTRLELTGDGINYFNIGVSVSARWDAVQRLVVAADICGLVLKKPLNVPGMVRLQRFAGMSIGASPYYSAEQQQLIAQNRFIDLRAYRRQLERGDLRQLIAAAAPAVTIVVDNEADAG
ncbi:MAG: hypothetical protein AAGC71_10160 [Pseudomonadota bacterium]